MQQNIGMNGYKIRTRELQLRQIRDGGGRSDVDSLDQLVSAASPTLLNRLPDHMLFKGDAVPATSRGPF